MSSQDADSQAKGLLAQEDYDLGGEGGRSDRVVVPEGQGSQLGKETVEGEMVSTALENRIKLEGEKKVEGGCRKEGVKTVEEGVGSEEGNVVVIPDSSEEEAKKGGSTTRGGSRGSTGSVPPGFRKIHGARAATQLGSCSPFGKMQKGGIRFLKRPSSSASSGARVGGVQVSQSKRNRPISSLPSQVIADVARNVGVAKPLSEEQVAKLKTKEEGRAPRE